MWEVFIGDWQFPVSGDINAENMLYMLRHDVIMNVSWNIRY